MKHWRELEVAALLGSQKSSATPHWPHDEAGALAQQLADTPQPLLHQLALWRSYQRAGQRTRPLAPSHAAPPEQLPYANTAMSKHVPYLLTGEGQILLTHWLDLARARGVLLPCRYLPTLLKLGEGNKTWRLAIAAVAGERGTWLAQHNPDWAWLIPHAFHPNHPGAHRDWQQASLAARELLFERLRAQHPAQALAFLQTIWAEENANTRKLLLEKLLTGLSMADHDFLENCLDDRSQAVKGVAVDLLARLPDSALVQRMQVVATQILHIRTGVALKRVEVIALESLTPTLERDGLEAKPKKADTLGDKAQWLRDVFACVGLDWLQTYTGMDTHTLLEKLLTTVWAEAFYHGLLLAATRQQHQDWLLALLHPNKVKPPLADFRLLPVLSQPQREQYVLQLLVAGKQSGTALREAIQVLTTLPTWQWSADFTLKLLERYQALNQSDTTSRYDSRTPVFLTLIGQCGDPTLGVSPNNYPPQVLNHWQVRRELQQAFVVLEESPHD